MRRIVKGPEPEELRNWKEENAESPQNLTYNNMPTSGVKRQMLAEQGYLCAYTMQAIPALDDCHIEHVIPRNQPNQPPHLDIEYSNLLACIPGKEPLEKWNPKYPYGAESKGGIHIDGNNFVSPLREDVERRFHYEADGSIKAATGDGAAENSVRILKLNHSVLVELRKAAIDVNVLDDASLTVESAEALSTSVLDFDSKGRLHAFCVAISQVAAWYARRMREVYPDLEH
jgi:uncharacterized protein (TIGR02646 family)